MGDQAILATMEVDLTRGSQMIYVIPNIMMTINDFFRSIQISILTRGYDQWRNGETNLLITRGMVGRLSNTSNVGFAYEVQGVVDYLTSHGVRVLPERRYPTTPLLELDWVIRPTQICLPSQPTEVNSRNLTDGRISISFSNYTAARDPQDENEENELIAVLTEKHPGIDICLGYEDDYNLITATADKEEFPFILVHKLTNHAVMLQQKSSGAAGFDLAADRPTAIELRGRALISTRLSLKIPWGTYGRIATRSSVAWNLGLDVGAGGIDSDYRVPQLAVTARSSDDFGSTDDGTSSSNPEPHSTRYKPNWDVLLSKEKQIISTFAEEETLIWHLQEDLGINYVGATSPGVTVLQPIDFTLETLIEEDENPTEEDDEFSYIQYLAALNTPKETIWDEYEDNENLAKNWINPFYTPSEEQQLIVVGHEMEYPILK
ncbi:hypothetical protein ZIOFF_028387 [Zingiber officinale]|uniref:dUTP diphosphatase n=1 Tax=Zingiber officinale TaxID=94328 RepID=A0A8J5GL82_ZINOF|nr:hypothetical protein ZIOFF_028387 [Zingiber officinale]